jgi:tRNA 2-thiouridine synthesizing protein A
MQYDLELDLRGLNCPLPILRTKKALATMPPGSRVRVLATDAGAPADFEHFCRQTGNVLEFSGLENGYFVLLLQRRPA